MVQEKAVRQLDKKSVIIESPNDTAHQITLDNAGNIEVDGTIFPTVTRTYIATPRFRVGIGGSAASSGAIEDVPCILFNDTQDQIGNFATDVIPSVDLSSVNPYFEVHWIITGAAGVGTETVDLKFEIRYRADGEAVDGAYDETITEVIEIPTGTAYIHGHTDFTLDRTLMATGEMISVKVTRLANTGGTDDYDDDFGIQDIWFVYSGTGGV